MTIHFGNVPAGSTLYIPFTTYDKTNGASVTMTGLAATDIEIYKDGSVTQRSSDTGYALLDTDGIDFDGITGLHGFSIDLSSNADAGFFAVGSFYWVVVSTITIDSQTVTFIPATFRIVAAEGTAGYPKTDAQYVGGTAQTGRDLGTSVLLSTGTGTGQLDFTSGVVKANLAQILGAAVTGTAAQIVAAFTKFFDKASPTGTVNSLPDAVAGATNGLFIAGTNAATTITTALTTTFTGNLTGSVATVAANGITATSMAADAINAASIKTGAITNAKFAAGAIDAAAIADAAIDNATFAADVGSTALATNMIAKASEKAVGVGGLSLTAQPWNAAWDAEVESEVNDALVANNLDHLLLTATAAADMTTEVADNTIMSRIIGGGDTSAFDPATDYLGMISDIDAEVDTIYGIVSNMGSTGSPTYAAPSSNTLTTGNQTGGTYANVDSANQSYHVLTDATGTLSNIYHWTLRPDEVAASITWIGRWNNNNDTLLFEIYDWTGTPGYKTWFTQVGVNGTTSASDFTKTMALVAKYTGTGANSGKVNVRISGTGLSSCTLSTDQLVLGVSNTSRTVGYSDGAVWLNTNATANTNTVSFVDGVADHPVTTIAAAITIADAMGLKRIRIANGSAVELSGSIANKSLVGKNWTLDLSDEAITGAYIEGATISGVSSGVGAEFVDCHFTGTQTVGGGDYFRCGFGVTTFTMLASSSYNFVGCFDDDPDTATSPIFVFAASAVVGARNWRGAFRANAMASTNKLTLDGAGRLVIGSTSEGGAITLRGFFPPVTGGEGLHSQAEFEVHSGVPITQTSRFDTSNVADAALDEVIEGSMTMRQALRVYLAALAGKSAGGGTTTITFQNLAGDDDRITATVDADGNRSAVTLDVT